MVHLITHGTNAELFLQKESKRKEMEATTLQLFKEKHAFLSQRQLFFFQCSGHHSNDITLFCFSAFYVRVGDFHVPLFLWQPYTDLSTCGPSQVLVQTSISSILQKLVRMASFFAFRIKQLRSTSYNSM